MPESVYQFFYRIFEFLRRRFGLIVRPAAYIYTVAASDTCSNRSGDERSAAPDASVFMFDEVLPLPGWNMLEVAIKSSQHVSSLQICIISGDDKADSECYFLPLKASSISKRLIYVPFSRRSVRIQFASNPGMFSFSHLQMVYLLPFFAYNRLAHRLLNNHSAYRDRSRSFVLEHIRQRARETGKDWRNLAMSQYEVTFQKFCGRHDYAKWSSQIESARHWTIAEAEKILSHLILRPELCVLLRAELDLAIIRSTIDSINSQSYPHWSLILVVSSDYPVHDRDDLNHLVQDIPRITLVDIEERSSGSNKGLQRAFERSQSDYVMVVKAGDCLSEHAFLHAACAISRNNDAILLYSDEDQISQEGRRLKPHFKPDWNPDLLLSQSYIGRLAIYRRNLLAEIGGFSGIEDLESLEGEYELTLRLLSYLSSHDDFKTLSKQILHLTEVLYHRRANKDDENADILGPVSRYLNRTSQKAVVEKGLIANSVRVRWSIPEPAPLVSLLIPTRDGIDILKPCIDAILERTEYSNYEVIILDNQSRCKKTLSYLNDIVQRHARVRVLRWDHQFNYSAINNYGVTQANGSIIGLINNDVEPINHGWLTEMVGQVCRAEIGCVGAKLYYGNDTIQHGGVILGLGGVAGHSHRFYKRDDDGYMGRLKVVQNLSAVTAACLLIRRDVYNEVGGLNESDLPVAYNDVDLCLKVREAGYRNLWTPYAELYHHESISRGADNTPQKRRRAMREMEHMRKIWGSKLDTDPAYNPNLTLVHEDFSLR